jgi:hypothetical protein
MVRRRAGEEHVVHPTAPIVLDMSGEDETTVAARLDLEIPALAHRELRAVGARLVVVTDPAGARHCTRECPEMLVAATLRQAHAALGLRAA